MQVNDKFEISDDELLSYYDHHLTQYFSALHSIGLTLEDYHDIQKDMLNLYSIRRRAYWDWFEYTRLHSYLLKDSFASEKDKECFIRLKGIKWGYFQEVDGLVGEYYHLMSFLRESLPMSLKDYLQRKTSITHLLYTNNNHGKIRLCASDNFLFLCHFHLEKTPSLSVTNSLGLGQCFGCGTKFHTVQYLEEYEDLSYQEALSLLARIYLIDIDGSAIKENHRLVGKYREVLVSDDFKNLLESGRKRALKKESTWENERALSKYEQDMNTIKRVKMGDHLSFRKENKKPKRLILEMPHFSQLEDF